MDFRPIQLLRFLGEVAVSAYQVRAKEYTPDSPVPLMTVLSVRSRDSFSIAACYNMFTSDCGNVIH